MAHVKDPVARAQKASTKVQAARLHQELDYELALGDHGDEWDGQAEKAQQMLEAKASEHDWGDLSELEATTAYTAAGGGHRMAHAWAPSLSRSAQTNLDADDAPDQLERGEHPAGADEAKPSEQKKTVRQRVAHRARAAGSGARHTARAGGRDLRRAYGALPTPPLGGARDLMGTALWGVLGLSLLYLLLQDAENPKRGWPSAVQTAVGSITAAIMAIVRPVDPLRPHSAAPGRAAAPVHVAATPTAGPTPLPPRQPNPTLRVAHPSATRLVHPVSRM